MPATILEMHFFRPEEVLDFNCDCGTCDINTFNVYCDPSLRYYYYDATQEQLELMRSLISTGVTNRFEKVPLYINDNTSSDDTDDPDEPDMLDNPYYGLLQSLREIVLIFEAHQRNDESFVQF
jgi:hypothetical protein